MVTKDILLSKLPPYEDKWVIVHPDQEVDHIIEDILNKHEKFSGYYDKIALCFDSSSTDKICDDLYNFCKKNIKYREESKKMQTTSLPTGILLRGYGDCKHYASFIGGVLDAINRKTNKNINWCYRFASYDFQSQDPHHVFVVVNPGGNEIWIDPTPLAETKKPDWIEDCFIKNSNMLVSNIGTVGSPLAFLATEEGQEAAGSILSSVTDLFKGLLDSFVIGDQVPNYPIKSKNTLQGILLGVKNLFPEPTSVAQANVQLANAIKYAQEAYAKGGNVNNTYGMVYDEVAATLRNYIASGGGKVITPGASPLPPNPNAGTGSNSNVLLLAAVGIGGYLIFKPQRKVSGMGTGKLLLIAAGGYLLYKFAFKDNKRQALIDWGNSLPSEGDRALVPVFKKMTSDEIADVYDFIFNYINKNIGWPASGTPLYNSIQAISVKYDIFT